METDKAISRAFLVRIIVFMLLVALLVAGGVYGLLSYLSASARTAGPADAAASQGTLVLDWLNTAWQLFWPVFVPATLVIFFLGAILLWLNLRRVARSHIQAAPRRQVSAATARSERESAVEIENSQRLFLHLLSVLQREGRLVDFFSEDLTPYPDAQIGAAVRNIHENCKKTMDKYLAPKAVVDQQEGDEITIEKDFDPNRIKLIGNVTGQPPFKGTVRHRGWRVQKLDLPTFSGRQDPAVISPAEVEVR